MKSYHFDVGDSNTGHVGLSARVRANSRQHALEILQDQLPDVVEVRAGIPGEYVEYINVYINADAFRVSDIDDVENDEER